MRLPVLMLACLTTWVTAQQQTGTNDNGLTGIAKQYADSFQNLGGRILPDKVNVYLIFYGNWTSSNAASEQSIFMNFVDKVSTTPWFNTFKEYTDNHGRKVTGPLNLAAAVNDAGSHGLNLTDVNTHKQIVVDAVHSGYLSPTNEIDSEGFYVLLAGKDVTDSGFCNNHCGYNYNSDHFQYMYIGYPGQCSDRCIPSMIKDASPNNNPAVDAAITIFSHELQDILTDPQGDAWVIRNGETKIELGDFCSGGNVSLDQWFGNVSTTENNAKYNLAINDKKYLVQTIFSRQKKACVLAS
ncbi:hypothetical protein EC973_006283 [Apophysomyces ossiformis]|uniref:Phosphate-induced protein 1 n=1 Tax=Apophysomyces ossiformis TaxID=679940 RepID=A0A8H7BW57_9FUNG|nr:hypothetical protein EC973_006283 [Apophysomyces ossiformis]